MNERRIVQTGIDVSRYQGKIDWARVKAGGTGFAIIKCTQGVNTVDPEFHRNMRNCAAVGLPVGAYVYSRARTAFAAAERRSVPQRSVHRIILIIRLQWISRRLSSLQCRKKHAAR